MPITRLHNFKIHYQNKREYHSLKREIFTQGIYEPDLELNDLELRTSQITILDIGAHIGLASLYFKWLYPAAHIIAVEPNPNNFHLLEQNIFENHLENVDLFRLAVDTKAGESRLHIDAQDEWLSNSSLLENSWTGEEKTKTIAVAAQTLSYFIDLIAPTDKPVILKMDIEGSESEVLFSAGNKLQIFTQMLIEFHPTGKQAINALIKHLESLGFEVNLEKKNKEVRDKYHRGLIMIKAKR